MTLKKHFSPHNQGVSGSSPGGATKNKKLAISDLMIADFFNG